MRGYRLPLRGAGDGLTNGRGLVVGDAAGLVDPLTGDGMYEAFLSARLASTTVVDFLEGRTDDLAAYAEATLRRSVRCASPPGAASAPSTVFRGSATRSRGRGAPGG